MAAVAQPLLELNDVRGSYETMLNEYNQETNMERKRKLHTIVVVLVNELNKRTGENYPVPPRPQGGRRTRKLKNKRKSTRNYKKY
jgi:hypothetical protein